MFVLLVQLDFSVQTNIIEQCVLAEHIVQLDQVLPSPVQLDIIVQLQHQQHNAQQTIIALLESQHPHLVLLVL